MPNKVSHHVIAPAGSGGNADVRLLQLDGLRAIAILLVLGFHTGYISFGWAGVQIFFVLSGFLITGILRRARKDTYFFRPFYIKRATRLLPPLLLFFLLVTWNGQISWTTTGLGYVFFLANFMQARPSEPLNDTGVTWSLAVEEHFYFIWPVAVRFLSRRWLIAISGGIVVLSPLLRAVATGYMSTWRPVYYWTPFQLDGMALGALLALLLEMESNRRWLKRISLPIAALCVVALAVLARLPGYRYMANSALFNGTSYSLLVFMSGGLLLYLVLKPHTLLSRTLAWRPAVVLGQISYGLYLFHYPMIRAMQALVIATGHAPARNTGLMGAALGIAVAWISFRWYELPVVGWGRREAKALGSNKKPGYLKP